MAKRLVACTVLAALSLVLCVFTVFSASKTPDNLLKPHTITWSEGSWGDCSFTYQVQRKSDIESSLQMMLKAGDLKDAETDNLSSVWTTQLIETYESGKTGFSDIELVVPIKVKNQVAPQLLVMSSRPNWTDYTIYVPNASSITSGFGYSTQYRDSIKWVVKNGELDYFVVFDRNAVAPENLRDTFPFRASALRREYRFDGDYNVWKVVSKRWVRLKEKDDSSGGQWTEKPSDIKFIYKPKVKQQSSVVIPKIANLAGIKVGFNSIDDTEKKLGHGKVITGGHPQGARVWQFEKKGWILYIDGFNYRSGSDGAVIDVVELMTSKRGHELIEGGNVPKVSPSYPKLGFWTFLPLGTSYEEAIKLLKQKGLPPEIVKGTILVKAKGISPPMNVNRFEPFRSWQAELDFEKNRLVEITITCD
ncbi:MAG: hypothetical protein ABFD64_03755 [Armatimonadota bacterium]